MLERFGKILLQLLTTRVAWPVLVSVGLLCMTSVLAINVAFPEKADRPQVEVGTQSAAPQAVAVAAHGGIARKQQLYIGLGVGVLLLALVPHYQWIGRLSYGVFGAALVMLVIVLFTEPINGSRRWFSLGKAFQLQPSELTKLAYVLVMAWFLRYRKDIREFYGLILPICITALPCALIIVEPDIGTALLFPLALFAMLIAAGARLRHMAFLAMVVAVALPTYYTTLMPQYAKNRIIAMMPSAQNDARHFLGIGYHAYMAKVAMGSGGLAGEASEGSYNIQHGLLPEAHTDFIYACIGAEWGFVGCVLVMLLYLAFFAAATEIAASTKDPFGRLLAIGIASMITCQALINMAMTMGLGPVVGIALPFVSYGGSSLLTNMLAAGILLNISVRRQGKSKLARVDYAWA